MLGLWGGRCVVYVSHVSCVGGREACVCRIRATHAHTHTHTHTHTYAGLEARRAGPAAHGPRDAPRGPYSTALHCTALSPTTFPTHVRRSNKQPIHAQTTNKPITRAFAREQAALAPFILSSNHQPTPQYTHMLWREQAALAPFMPEALPLVTACAEDDWYKIIAQVGPLFSPMSCLGVHRQRNAPQRTKHQHTHTHTANANAMHRPAQNTHQHQHPPTHHTAPNTKHTHTHTGPARPRRRHHHRPAPEPRPHRLRRGERAFICCLHPRVCCCFVPV